MSGEASPSMIISSPSCPNEDDQFAKNDSMTAMPDSMTSGGNGLSECSVLAVRQWIGYKEVFLKETKRTDLQ